MIIILFIDLMADWIFDLYCKIFQIPILSKYQPQNILLSKQKTKQLQKQKTTSEKGMSDKQKESALKLSLKI